MGPETPAAEARVVLLFVILSSDEYLEEILEGFLELGITGATVLQARGMGEILAQEVPIFAGLRGLFPGGEGHHRLLFSVTNRVKAKQAISLLDEVCGSLERRGTGIAFTVPVEESCGLAEEL